MLGDELEGRERAGGEVYERRCWLGGKKQVIYQAGPGGKKQVIYQAGQVRWRGATQDGSHEAGRGSSGLDSARTQLTPLLITAKMRAWVAVLA